ncbi:MAG: HAMP domain-containing sensor histidine kinase [Gemmatimonadaceae bacterium]
MRRGKPELLVAVLILLLLGSYVWYTQRVIVDLRADARVSGQMYRRVYRAFADQSPGSEDQALLDLSQSITDQGVPLILMSPDGKPGGHANLPFDKDNKLPHDDPRVLDYVSTLAAQHPPISDSLIGTIYYGDSPVVQGLRVIPILQAVTAAILLLGGIYIIRTRGDAARERLWAGMARESAHQLGTPLSSLSGWIELLEDSSTEPLSQKAVVNMRADLVRLERVANRFERIGREPKFEEIDVGGIIERMTKYFQSRVPTLVNPITVEGEIAPNLAVVRGDGVLLEWAIEVLTKNAIDALAGRGGHVWLSAKAGPDDAVVIRVADDGPGIPKDLRDRVFEPGFSTKKSGWGIGLSLAKRIVEENHGGKLALANTEHGATFEIILQ